LPARIYSLAKELKLDSKVLVDLCPKAGISGKGSALASLTDEEVEKIRGYLSGLSARTAPASAPPKVMAPTPPPKLAPAKEAPIPILKRPKAKLPAVAPAAEPPAEPASGEQVQEVSAAPAVAPAVAEAAPAPFSEAAPSAAPAPEAGPAPEPPPPTSTPPAEPKRPDFSRLQEPGRLRNLAVRTSRRGGDGTKREGEGKSPPATGPVFRVAPLPAAKQPPVAPTPAEPPAQKPDMRLPKDVIRPGKAGSKPLQKLIKEMKDLEQKKGGREEGPPVTPGPPRKGVRGDRERTVVEEEGRAPLSKKALREKRAKRRLLDVDDEGATQTATRLARRQKRSSDGKSVAAPRKSNVVVQLPCSVRTFSEAIGKPAALVVLTLKTKFDITANINATLEPETAELLAAELGVEVDFRQPVDPESQLHHQIDSIVDPPEDLQPRPPIVTFLGHVDHGKTSLLDRMIGTQIVKGEAGGITQQIRAFRVAAGDRAITFVDTPGHEAFTEMRARGANVTDIAVLVVAADDGVMPQTEEAINHARAAEVPIIVALNKIDLPGVDINRIYQQLAASGLLPQEWGGETEVVKTSALTGQGIDELKETILTIADLHELRGNPKRPAHGTCLEGQRHERRGVVAKFLVQNGSLRVGDIVVCGGSHGRVKAMHDTLDDHRRHDLAGPSMPINVIGLDEVPNAGDRFYALDDISRAREIAQAHLARSRTQALAGASQHITLENLLERIQSGAQDETQTLNVILRADARGSIEAILKEFAKLDHPEVKIKTLQCMVGGITEADVHLADASDAIIIGFNVVPDDRAETLAKDRGVQIRRYDIIYRITEDLKLALEGMLKPQTQERELGQALVQRVFEISRIGSIAGCRVLRGVIRREPQVRLRVIRDSTIIGDYPLESLRREKDDAREVREGFECGIKLAGFNDIKQGDLLEAYKIEEVARTLSN
jgi:translation initiation factor IF-2